MVDFLTGFLVAEPHSILLQCGILKKPETLNAKVKIMSNESKIKKQYLQYIDDLRCAKVETVKFKCPCCDFEIESVKNTTSKDWNTVSTCPECEKFFYKVNIGKGKGVAVRAA